MPRARNQRLSDVPALTNGATADPGAAFFMAAASAAKRSVPFGLSGTGCAARSTSAAAPRSGSSDLIFVSIASGFSSSSRRTST